MIDGQHSYTFFERFIAYGSEAITLGIHALLIIFIAGCITYLITRRSSLCSCRTTVFNTCMLIICLMEQLTIWIIGRRHLHFPLLYFYFLTSIGIFTYKKLKSDTTRLFTPLFWIGSIWSIFVWFSALLITNTTISVTGSYLMPGLIAGIIFLTSTYEVFLFNSESTSSFFKVLYNIVVLLLLGTTLFVKGFLICENEGVRSTAFFVRQKALSGVSKFVYYRYIDGYTYNMYTDFVSPYISEDDSLLLIGTHSLYYLLDDAHISAYSTISTPTFDERLFEYWRIHPERYPDYVVVDTQYWINEDTQIFLNSLNLGVPIAENEYFILYHTPSSNIERN